MATAQQARDWARTALTGIGDSLYTPFCGPDGENIDWDAYRQLVRYCVRDLGHPMLWLTSGLAEFWSLTVDERKQLLEVAVAEARAINPGVVIQACTSTTGPGDCLELTRHAQAAGADIVYIQTPSMEVHGGAGVLRFFEYIAQRSDIALGLFNSPSSGYLLSPEEIIAIYERIPAICAIKEGSFETWRSAAVAAGAPGMQVWECNPQALTAGWASRGIVCKALLGTSGYVMDFPGRMMASEYHALVWQGRIDDALAYARESGMDQLVADLGDVLTAYPGRPGYFTHWGEAIKRMAAAVGLPAGDYPHSRPPQAFLPEAAKQQIHGAYRRAGLSDIARTAA